jgi:hypothetical protein
MATISISLSVCNVERSLLRSLNSVSSGEFYKKRIICIIVVVVVVIHIFNHKIFTEKSIPSLLTEDHLGFHRGLR